jgi:hypothetical protein
MGTVKLVSPVYEARATAGSRAPRLASLAGARIGLLDNDKPKADRLLEHIATLLEHRYSVAGFVRLRKGSATKPAEGEIIARLLRETDAIVTAIGD